MAIESIKSLAQIGSPQANKLPGSEKIPASTPIHMTGIPIIGLNCVNQQPVHQVGQNFNMLF